MLNIFLCFFKDQKFGIPYLIRHSETFFSFTKSTDIVITESRPLKSVAREKWGTHDALRAQ